MNTRSFFHFYVLANPPHLTALLISLVLGMSDPCFMDILNPAIGKVSGSQNLLCAVLCHGLTSIKKKKKQN